MVHKFFQVCIFSFTSIYHIQFIIYFSAFYFPIFATVYLYSYIFLYSLRKFPLCGSSSVFIQISHTYGTTFYMNILLSYFSPEKSALCLASSFPQCIGEFPMSIPLLKPLNFKISAFIHLISLLLLPVHHFGGGFLLARYVSFLDRNQGNIFRCH